MTEIFNFLFMKNFFVLMVAVVAVCAMAGCGRTKEVAPEGVEVYCTDDAKETGDIRDVFSSVELIPLEFAGEHYPQNVRRLKMTDSLILVFDMNNRLTVFGGDGKYISSSAEKLGQGPEEFAICLGYGWNPYSQEIEILGFSKIMFYDKDFNYVRSCPAPNIPGKQIITEIFDLSPTRHVLLNNDADDPNIYLFDSEKGEILDKNTYIEWTKGGSPSLIKDRFYRLPDGEIYCMPWRVNDKVLKLNPDSLTFENVVTIIAGKNSYSKDEFDEMCSSAESTHRLSRIAKERPRCIMFNSKILFQDIAIDASWFDSWCLVADRQSGDVKKLSDFEDEKRIFPEINDIDEEYAYSVIRKEMLAEAPKLLLDKAEKMDSVLEAIEEDTYVVLKYRIRE